MIRWALAPLAVVLVLTVVSELRLDPGAPAPQAAPARAAPSRSCGTYDLRPSDLSPHFTEQRCLVDAFRAGQPARLQLRTFTVEGDPVRVEYQVVGAELVEVRVDAARRSVSRCRALAIGRGRPAHDRCSPA